VIHAWTLSNAAWLKKPTAATSKKLLELVALCSAALRPSRKAWKAFLRELRRLESEKKITTAEQIARVAQELVSSRIAEVESEGDVDAKTINELIDRAMQDGLERTRVAVNEVKSEADARLAEVQGALAEVQDAQHAQAETYRQNELRVRGRILAVARGLSVVVFLGATVLVAIGVALGLPGMFPQAPGFIRWGSWVAAGFVAVLGTMNLVEGTTVRDLRLRLQAFIEKSLLRWLAVRDEGRS
jgi:hypothetical protein